MCVRIYQYRVELGLVVENRAPHLLVQVSQLPSGLLRFSCQLCCADLQHICRTNANLDPTSIHKLCLDRKQKFVSISAPLPTFFQSFLTPSSGMEFMVFGIEV